MTKEQIARDMLDKALNEFVDDVREVIQRKVNDSIYISDVLNGNKQANMSPEQMTKQIVLGWVQRIMLETVNDEFGELATTFFFDSAYYQIGAQKLGPDDFYHVASPYENGKGKDKFK